MAGLTSTGFEPKTLSDIQAEISTALLAGISTTLNLSSTSPDGQKIGAISSQLRQLWEAGQAIYSSRDIDEAESAALTSLVKSVGVFRQPATPSTALMSCTLTNNGGPANDGVYPEGVLRVYVVGNPSAVFTNDEELVITVSGAQTDLAFTCEDEGVVRANANTLTEIANPVTGFSAPTNPAAATVGTEEESDAELYARWLASVARRGSSTVDAIRADVLAVDGVTSCLVLENTADTAVGGIAAHGVGVYVVGGTDAAVAQAIWDSKPAGIETSGSSDWIVADTQGIDHTVRWTRPTEVRLYAAVTVTALTGVYPESEFRTVEIAVHNSARLSQLTDLAELDTSSSSGLWGVGEDIIINKIRAAIMRMPGIVDITSLTVDTVDPPVGTTNIAIDSDEYGDFDIADIDVVVNYVSGAP
jgi:uncharacterized phage protein gp47/JayE